MDLYPHHLATWSRARLEAAIRRRVQTAYLGNGLILARILGRHKIFLRSSDRGFACHLMLDGFWEMWLTQFFAQRVKPGMTVVDVGANFGYYTLLFGDAVGDTGRVLAVEPNPDAVSLLSETILLNGHASRTQVIPCALAASEGAALLYAPDGEPKNAMIVDRAGLPGGRTMEVQIRTLDQLALELPKVDLVKIDAEGGEVEIVAGMRELMARDRPMIVLEFNAARYADPEGFLNALLALYGTFHEISFNGELVSPNSATVIDRRSTEDRLLFFA